MATLFGGSATQEARASIWNSFLPWLGVPPLRSRRGRAARLHARRTLGQDGPRSLDQGTSGLLSPKKTETSQSRTIVDIPQEPINTKFKGRRFLRTRKIRLATRTMSLSICWASRKVVRNSRDAVVTWRTGWDSGHIARDAMVGSCRPQSHRPEWLNSTRCEGRAVVRCIPICIN
jgi:hypothetical protein